MEANPTLPPSVEQSSSDKKETRKRKKKNVENLGTFLVEANPRQEEKEKPSSHKKSESFLGRINDREDRHRTSPEDDVELKLKRENDKTPELDGEAPLEHLSHQETIAVNQDLGKVRQEEISKELQAVLPDTTAAKQAEAAEEFIALVSETGDPELAAQLVADARDLEPIHFPESEIIESWVEESELTDYDIDPDASEPVEGEIPLNSNADEVLDFGPDPDTGTGGGGSSGVPPHIPTRGGGANWFGGGPIGPMPTGPTPGSGSSSSHEFNTISVEDANYYEQKALGRGLLIGGIVGYLIGRRRGRIKTEKKLLPVQKKLQKEVQNLQSRLIESEYAIRRAVVQREQEQYMLKSAKNELANRDKQERVAAAEAPKLHSQKLPLERIGKVVVAAEALPVKRTSVPEKAGKVSPAVAEKQASTMRRSELLELTEKITIDGTSLRQIYETHLIGERGLRRLVAEYMAGGNIRQALRRELVEREIDFERDPVLRDRARASLSESGNSAVSNLIIAAGASLPGDQNQSSAKQSAQSTDSDKPQPSQGIINRHLADITIVGAIVILLALILCLVIRGH